MRGIFAKPFVTTLVHSSTHSASRLSGQSSRVTKTWLQLELCHQRGSMPAAKLGSGCRHQWWCPQHIQLSTKMITHNQKALPFHPNPPPPPPPPPLPQKPQGKIVPLQVIFHISEISFPLHSVPTPSHPIAAALLFPCKWRSTALAFQTPSLLLFPHKTHLKCH